MPVGCLEGGIHAVRNTSRGGTELREPELRNGRLARRLGSCHLTTSVRRDPLTTSRGGGGMSRTLVQCISPLALWPAEPLELGTIATSSEG